MMFSRTTPKPTHGPPPSTITKRDFDLLMSRLDDQDRRDIRIETRLCRLLAAHGLDQQGKPIPSVTTQEKP